MTIKPEVLEAVKQILAVNQHCALTGGNGLLLHKKNIRREPTDIDIYCPDSNFKIIPGMSMPEKKSAQTEDERYNDEDSEDIRQEYLYKGFKIDVFTPKDKEQRQSAKLIDKVKVCSPADTIRAKLTYIDAGGSANGKHKLDVMFYLLMN